VVEASLAGLQVGAVVAGKYVLLRKLRAGGMGAVFEAQHQVIGRRFAVKFLRPELANEHDMLARFRREAQSAGSLESEHVVAVVDFGSTESGLPYIVMELLEGNDLRTELARPGRLLVARAVHLMIQACRGLSVAHAHGIVHRDLKPENLFITKRSSGELLKILDFGVAKLQKSPSSELATKPGAIMGTLNYMPPEQIRGADAIDQRADLYSLGAILYECLSGELPHKGARAHEVLYSILHRPIAALDSLCPGLPQGLSDVVHRALAHDVGDRFPSAEALATALAAYTDRPLTPFDWPSSSSELRSEQAVASVDSGEPNEVEEDFRRGTASEHHAQPSAARTATSVSTARSRGRRSAKLLHVYAGVVGLAAVLGMAAYYFLAPDNRGNAVGASPASGSVSVVPAARIPAAPTPAPSNHVAIDSPLARASVVAAPPAVPAQVAEKTQRSGVARPKRARPSSEIAEPLTSKNGAPILE
jgi:eukaryotic-like serine/threonine-protein kinase